MLENIALNCLKWFFKDNNGGDDDDEGANTERKFLLNRMSIKDNNQYEVVSKDNNFMDFSWDGQNAKDAWRRQ